MKVLLAIDGTEQSDAAVEMLQRLNLENISEICVLTVVDMALPFAHDIYSGMITNTIEIEKAAQSAADEALQRTSVRIGNFTKGKVTTKSVVGSPESKIVEEAEDMEADLIVVGSHGYSRWERLLLGSVSDSVVHHAPCSVLVVRTKNNS